MTNKETRAVDRYYAERKHIAEQVRLLTIKLQDELASTSDEKLAILIEDEYYTYSINQKVNKK